MEGWHYHYVPFDRRLIEDGIVNLAMYEQYLQQSFWPSQLEMLVTEPLDEAIKKSKKANFDFGGFEISVSHSTRSSKSWKEVYEKIKTFLEIRSDDSKAKGIKGLKYIEGIGYCISIEDVVKEIDDRVEEFTSTSSFPLVNWPKRKKSDEPLRDIMVQDIDYSKISNETALISLNVRRFKSYLKEEVLDAYTKLNEVWMRQQTGYDREKLPPKELSPIKRVRHVGDLMYIVINLVREDKPQYDDIIQALLSDLRAIKEGQKGLLWEIYRPTENGFVNIGRLEKRLESLYKDHRNIKSDVRYEISP